jgi:hypothetical protein
MIGQKTGVLPVFSFMESLKKKEGDGYENRKCSAGK